MFPIDFEFYTDDTSASGKNGNTGKNFYPITVAQLEHRKLKEVKYKVGEGVNGTASWGEPDKTLQTNVYRLMEHPKLSELLVKRANLMKIYKTTKSAESKDALEKYMGSTTIALAEILETAHRLYFVDDKNYIRSEHSFEYCMNKAIDAGYQRLLIMKLLFNVDNPSGILSTQINNQLSNIVTDNYRNLGGRTEDAITKKKKGKKNK